MMVRLESTRGCPLGRLCESCGTGLDLGVATLDCPVGELCMPLCGECVATARIPSVGAGTAVSMVLRHCAHLGIDLDQMAATLEQGR